MKNQVLMLVIINKYEMTKMHDRLIITKILFILLQRNNILTKCRMFLCKDEIFIHIVLLPCVCMSVCVFVCACTYTFIYTHFVFMDFDIEQSL